MQREELKPCQAYMSGHLVCRNGFPHRAFCRTGLGSLPHCLDDDFAPPHLVDENGNMKLAAHRRADDAAR